MSACPLQCEDLPSVRSVSITKGRSVTICGQGGGWAYNGHNGMKTPVDTTIQKSYPLSVSKGRHAVIPRNNFSYPNAVFSVLGDGWEEGTGLIYVVLCAGWAWLGLNLCHCSSSGMWLCPSDEMSSALIALGLLRD